MKKNKLLKVTALLTVVGALLVGCGSNNEKGEAVKDTYTIACDAKYAPFSMEINGKYEGIDVEILAAVAEAEGFKYELKPMDFSAIIPGITSNQLDGGIAGMSITDERKQTLDFSDSYFESGLSIVAKGDNEELKSIDDIKGKAVAVKNGTAGEKWALENEDKYELKVSHYEDSPTMFMAVENGNVDFALEDYPVIAYKIKVDNDGKLKIVGDKVTTADYGFAVKKGSNKELMKKFQAGLKTIKGNGTYDDIVGKYINQ